MLKLICAAPECKNGFAVAFHKPMPIKFFWFVLSLKTLVNTSVTGQVIIEYKYGSLIKCENKMAGYWPSSFLCVFMHMDRDEIEVHKLAKKERSQYPAIFSEQTWSIKDLLYGFRGNFSCGIQRVVPSGQDGSTPSCPLG